MNDNNGSVTVRVHPAIAEIPAAAWDACAGDVNPSVSYAFLSALEDSGSTTSRTGWAPQHLSLAGADGAIVGVVPLYSKSHSYGEYVFDWGWAEAWQRSGRPYYPKLQSAVPFTPAGGRVDLRAGAVDGRIEIAVADTGRGIPPEALDHIFDPFVQVGRSTTGGGEGLGLGLAISRELARAMGGNLRVASEVGRGSVFTLELPRG